MIKNKTYIPLQNEAADKFLETKAKLGFKKNVKFVNAIANGDYVYINLYREIYREVVKQGNNLNQIARHANIENQFDLYVVELLEQIRADQKHLLGELKNYDNYELQK